MFVATGDLISELDVTVMAGNQSADMGGQISVRPGSDVVVTVRLRDPEAPNGSGRPVDVRRVYLIVGEIAPAGPDRSLEVNPSTRIEQRFGSGDWTADGEILTMQHTLIGVRGPVYVRVRGTEGTALEPGPDPAGEDPSSDLWFYGNPVFVAVNGALR